MGNYSVCAFESTSEHAPVCGVDAEILVQEAGEILSGLIAVHGHCYWRRSRMGWCFVRVCASKYRVG